MAELMISEDARQERQRCIDIINAARNGLIDSDLRAIRSRIESGDALNIEEESGG